MAVEVCKVRSVAHLPLGLGMLRKLEVMTVIDGLLPPHPDNILSCGRGGSLGARNAGRASGALQGRPTAGGARDVAPSSTPTYSASLSTITASARSSMRCVPPTATRCLAPGHAKP